MVRIKKSEILNSKEFNFKESLLFNDEVFASYSRINSLKNVEVKGYGHYDDIDDLIKVHLDIKGVMICPCAITLEDVEVPFVSESDEIFSFHKQEDEDILEVKGDTLDLNPVIFQLILQEVPLKVVKEGKIDYPKGDGWQVLTESEYAKQKGNAIDPRLAKLKEYKFEEKED